MPDDLSLAITQAEQALKDAEMLSPAQVGRLIGFSASFIRLEIKAGTLRAVKAGRGAQRKRWRIERAEAVRYRRQMLGQEASSQ